MIDLINLPNGTVWGGSIRKDGAGRLHISGTLESLNEALPPRSLKPESQWLSRALAPSRDLFASAGEALPPVSQVSGAKAEEAANAEERSKRQSEANRGSRNPNARLSEAQAKYIRSSKESPAVLSKAFGVCKTHIWHIRSGKKWKSLP